MIHMELLHMTSRPPFWYVRCSTNTVCSFSALDGHGT
jgi:hypothetical protein